jgi:hypothetical protein
MNGDMVIEVCIATHFNIWKVYLPVNLEMLATLQVQGFNESVKTKSLQASLNIIFYIKINV